MNVAVFVSALLLLFSCSTKKKESLSLPTDSVQTTGKTKPAQPDVAKPTPALSKQDAVAGAGKWLYEQRVDNEGRTVYKASTLSPTRLDFGFPYTGGSTATLTIRTRTGSDTHLYIQVSNGQFNRSFQGGMARIRFDRQSFGTYSISAAENGSANIVFFDAVQGLLRKVKAARTMTVSIEFAGQGNRQVDFKTAGLQWNH